MIKELKEQFNILKDKYDTICKEICETKRDLNKAEELKKVYEEEIYQFNIVLKFFEKKLMSVDFSLAFLDFLFVFFIIFSLFLLSL